MKNKTQKHFSKYGYLLKSGLYAKNDISRYEAEFDKIIKQLKRSGENINARWNTCLTKDMHEDFCNSPIMFFIKDDGNDSK